MIVRTPYLLALVTIVLAIFPLKAATHDTIVPTRQPLEAFPLRLGGWEGRTDFLEPGILAALRVDDYLLRRYWTPSGKVLWMYVGYWGSQHRDGTRVHSPAVCLPGAGWIITNSRAIPIRLAGRTIMVNHAEVQKDEARQLVLYWYQIKGTVLARELQAFSFLAWTSLTQRRSDEALVRVNAPVVGALQDTFETESAFVQAAFPQLDRLLPR